MAKTKNQHSPLQPKKKKTRQGQGKFSHFGNPGPCGGNKGYRKKNRGQGK